MNETIILHHHDPSPYAEQIRKVFGIKDLKWTSVQIPMVMPKPDLTLLTGGYRGTPVLQIGADIFCDTGCIVQELERRHPQPGLFTSGSLVNNGMRHWADEAFWTPGSALALFENSDQIPDAVFRDRKDYFHNLDFSRFLQDAPHFRAQLQAHAALMEQQLADGRLFLCGASPEWLDLAAWKNIWMAAGNIPSSRSLFADMPNLAGWSARMEDFGHGTRDEISAEDALEIAGACEPAPPGVPSPVNTEGSTMVGKDVTVAPMDHRDTPVCGRLTYLSTDRIIITRSAERIGEVAIHFPRIGYRIDEAD